MAYSSRDVFGGVFDYDGRRIKRHVHDNLPTKEMSDDLRILFTGLKQLQVDKTFCDVTIKVGSKEFRAHKNILAASSGYFKTMFASGFREAGAAEILVEGESDIFEVLLDYMYSGEMLNLLADNAGEILSMACYLDLAPHALQECERCIADAFRDKSITLQEAFGISMRPEPELRDITEAAKGYIVKNFTDLAAKPGFVEETTYECLDVFISNIIDRGKEKQICPGITKWLKYDWATRKQYAYDILTKLHLEKVPADDLKRLLEEDMSDITECNILLDEAMKRLASTDSDKGPLLLPTVEYAEHIVYKPPPSTKTAFRHHLCKGLRTFQSENTFCDVNIKIGSKTFPAHKNILAASTSYFKTMFTSGLQEADITEVSLEEDGDVFAVILDFIYSGGITGLSGNIDAVLIMAIDLKFNAIVKYCERFLCIDLKYYSAKLSLQQVCQISLRPEPELFSISMLANKYLAKNITYLSKQAEFMGQVATTCMTTVLDKYFDSIPQDYRAILEKLQLLLISLYNSIRSICEVLCDDQRG
ncbi:uncharacterized protein [Amphiura filiformis]|uniref:uncharacterized protein n=1 Tax=Amphiura filiformis TaxID=82378 RepID=UPI003B215F12